MQATFQKLLSLPGQWFGVHDTAPARRADLDWLRILAFGLLIFYHIGMLYVADWGYHVKSSHSSEVLQNLMLLVNPWRMPVLWLVSGIAIRFVMTKVSMWRYIGLRSVRLLLPLFFAILVIVPPQLYYEMTFNGDLSVSYLEFYRAFFDINHPMFEGYQAGVWPHMDVNHLWYLRELWLFSMYLLLLMPLLNAGWMKRSVDWLSRQNGILVVLLVLAPVWVIELAIEDNREQIGFTFLVYGYLLGWHEGLWARLNLAWRPMLLLALVSYVVLVVFYNQVYMNQPEPRESWVMVGAGLVYGTCRVVWLIAILGLSANFLNRPSKRLTYFNEAVYPYYILHQTIIIVVYSQLARFELGPVVEPLTVIALTIAGCALGFELVRRVSVLRPLFGLKAKSSTPYHLKRVGYALGMVLVTPFALEVLI